MVPIGAAFEIEGVTNISCNNESIEPEVAAFDIKGLTNLFALQTTCDLLFSKTEDPSNLVECTLLYDESLRPLQYYMSTRSSRNPSFIGLSVC